MHWDFAEVVDAPEGLVASDRSAKPNIRVTLPPIRWQAFHDAVRPFGEDQIDQVRRVADDAPCRRTPCQRRRMKPHIHLLFWHEPLVHLTVEEIAEAVGEH